MKISTSRHRGSTDKWQMRISGWTQVVEAVKEARRKVEDAEAGRALLRVERPLLTSLIRSHPLALLEETLAEYDRAVLGSVTTAAATSTVVVDSTAVGGEEVTAIVAENEAETETKMVITETETATGIARAITVGMEVAAVTAAGVDAPPSRRRKRSRPLLPPRDASKRIKTKPERLFGKEFTTDETKKPKATIANPDAPVAAATLGWIYLEKRA
ncbi:hypothetical protein BDK51DRAFT_46994 [Blyttiomyces helicus]|uniref:Uncharacterized protein n=1 Tax=Blyttiomyces helicus TaxID=388810 RepID=A0A4P9W8B5_9FUNG|nr:hypothetical protein BDK51DRAFT_46994 [Blyttiomyces helicus]|eukprot:RKO86406.1 hypothetical protein BDK51DRAFT_46994 [Blyttiomyces helicus]